MRKDKATSSIPGVLHSVTKILPETAPSGFLVSLVTLQEESLPYEIVFNHDEALNLKSNITRVIDNNLAVKVETLWTTEQIAKYLLELGYYTAAGFIRDLEK